MQVTHLLIDGYSLVHQDPSVADLVPHHLDVARERLTRKLEEVARDFASATTVVFDGRQEAQERQLTSSLLDIVFSPRHLTADTVIERMVEEASHPETILVVTSDHAERDTVSSAGAQTMSCRQFLETCERRRSQHSETSHRISKSKGFALGDSFPEL